MTLFLGPCYPLAATHAEVPTMSAAPEALDPALLEHLLDTIVEAIPAGDNDTDQTRATRRTAARLALLALKPTDAFQAMLAAQAVTFHYAIMDAFRRAAQPDLPPAMAARQRSNAATLSRTMQATLRTLRQHQTPPAEAQPKPRPVRPAARQQSQACIPAAPAGGTRTTPPHPPMGRNDHGGAPRHLRLQGRPDDERSQQREGNRPSPLPLGGVRGRGSGEGVRGRGHPLGSTETGRLHQTRITPFVSRTLPYNRRSPVCTITKESAAAR